MKHKAIVCHECKKPILNKHDLAVVGNSFVTYHCDCFEKAKRQKIYPFFSGYRINGPFTWVMLIVLNILLWGTYFVLDAPLDEVQILSLFISSWIILFRIISYMLYERYYED